LVLKELVGVFWSVCSVPIYSKPKFAAIPRMYLVPKQERRDYRVRRNGRGKKTRILQRTCAQPPIPVAKKHTHCLRIIDLSGDSTCIEYNKFDTVLEVKRKYARSSGIEAWRQRLVLPDSENTLIDSKLMMTYFGSVPTAEGTCCVYLAPLRQIPEKLAVYWSKSVSPVGPAKLCGARLTEKQAATQHFSCRWFEHDEAKEALGYYKSVSTAVAVAAAAATEQGGYVALLSGPDVIEVQHESTQSGINTTATREAILAAAEKELVAYCNFKLADIINQPYKDRRCSTDKESELSVSDTITPTIAAAWEQASPSRLGKRRIVRVKT
jgi:hypothetical protein